MEPIAWQKIGWKTLSHLHWQTGRQLWMLSGGPTDSQRCLEGTCQEDLRKIIELVIMMMMGRCGQRSWSRNSMTNVRVRSVSYQFRHLQLILTKLRTYSRTYAHPLYSNCEVEVPLWLVLCKDSGFVEQTLVWILPRTLESWPVQVTGQSS